MLTIIVGCEDTPADEQATISDRDTDRQDVGEQTYMSTMISAH
jgi:hypothetical protein